MSNMDPHQNIVNLIGGQTKGGEYYCYSPWRQFNDQYGDIVSARRANPLCSALINRATNSFCCFLLFAKDVLYVVVEYCANGDLYNYVKKRRTDHSWLGQKESGTSIEYVTRLRIAFDVANGMNYLSTKQVWCRSIVSYAYSYFKKGCLSKSIECKLWARKGWRVVAYFHL